MAVETFPDPWLIPVWPVKLGEGVVHVWRACLDVAVEELQARSQLLTEEERARGARYLRTEVGSRFMAGRGLLRRLLGMYLGSDAAEVEFVFNSFGKPALSPKHGAGDLCFNLSHSHDCALLAFTCGRKLGVDIEKVRPDFATREIAQRFFSPAEAERLQALPVEAQVSAFFQCWTRKEGYIKARGEGLSLGLDSFEVAFGPGLEPAVLQASDEANAKTRWLVVDLQPRNGFAGALVVERPVQGVYCWNADGPREMRSRVSAGVMLYRWKNGRLEVFLAHPGGPLFTMKDDGYWTIPKGEVDAGEDLLATAQREFKEETGVALKPGATFLPLGSIQQQGGKIVHAWAVEQEWDDTQPIRSNEFTMEWPPGSGCTQSFPEVDRAQFFSIDEARCKLKERQVPLLDQLLKLVQRG